MRKSKQIKILQEDVKILKETSERLEAWLMLILSHNQIKSPNMESGKWYQEPIDESK